jgi:hypothetical protein
VLDFGFGVWGCWHVESGGTFVDSFLSLSLSPAPPPPPPSLVVPMQGISVGSLLVLMGGAW